MKIILWLYAVIGSGYFWMYQTMPGASETLGKYAVGPL